MLVLDPIPVAIENLPEDFIKMVHCHFLAILNTVYVFSLSPSYYTAWSPSLYQFPTPLYNSSYYKRHTG